MAFRQQRLLEEDMRFGVEAQDVAGPGPEHADGLLAARVLKKGELCNAQDGTLLRLMSADCCCNFGRWEHPSSTLLDVTLFHQKGANDGGVGFMQDLGLWRKAQCSRCMLQD